VKQLSPTELKRLHRAWNRRTTRRAGLLLDSVQSPWNVGAMTRTAAALRVDHLYLAGASIAPSHPKAGKTAMGTERYLVWSRHPEVAEAVDTARRDGFCVVGLELAHGALPLADIDLGGDVCLAVGHEDHGLSPACLALCDQVAFIPQLGRVGSLNVATAAAIGLYEIRRREWVATRPADGPHEPVAGP
jgi:tRNA (guanosine-2'-O-)-methyltransferase